VEGGEAGVLEFLHHEKTKCIYEMNVAQNITDGLMLYLETEF
jgi:hypothetical protein